MKVSRNLALGKVAFRGDHFPLWTREGCARIGTDEGRRDNTASTAVAAPIPSEIR